MEYKLKENDISFIRNIVVQAWSKEPEHSPIYGIATMLGSLLADLDLAKGKIEELEYKLHETIQREICARDEADEAIGKYLKEREQSKPKDFEYIPYLADDES